MYSWDAGFYFAFSQLYIYIYFPYHLQLLREINSSAPPLETTTSNATSSPIADKSFAFVDLPQPPCSPIVSPSNQMEAEYSGPSRLFEKTCDKSSQTTLKFSCTQCNFRKPKLRRLQKENSKLRKHLAKIKVTVEQLKGRVSSR